MSHLTRAARRTVLAGMVAYLSLIAFVALAVATAMPTLAADLDGLRLYTWVFAASSGAGIAGMLVAGRWCDRAGPGPAMRAGIAAFVVGVLAVGLAPSMTAVLLGRVVQGAGGGMTGVALYVLVAHVFPPAGRPRVFAVFAAAWAIPALVGPLLAGLVTEHLGWRWVFLGIPALALPAWWWLRPGLAAASSPGDHGTGAAPSPVRTRLAIDVLTARRGLGTVIAIRGLVAAAFVGSEVLLPLALTLERQLRPAQAGLILTLGALGWTTGSWLRGRAATTSTHRCLRLGSVVLAGGILASSTIVGAAPLAVAMVAWTAAGLGMGLVYPTLSMLTLELSTPETHGTASSALQVTESAASTVALFGSGALLWIVHDAAGPAAYPVCLALAAALAVLAAALVSRVDRTDESAPPSTSRLAPPHTGTTPEAS